MPSKLRWLLPKIDEAAVRSLAESLELQVPAVRVLWKRGYRDPEAVRRFLHPSIDDLHDPFLLKDMRPAVERLQRAIVNKEKILLYGDYDVDGATSIVVLKKAIELTGGSAAFHVPHRLRDGYGMRPEVVDRAAADGVNLIVSVDTGIRAAATVARANALGIDVIVTDHHLPDTELPPACAVLNPNRRDCEYPEKNLCGAGVAFKLVQALFGMQGWTASKQRRMIQSFLKLVAIGTVADVVPLTGENRILVKHGLVGLRTVSNPGLRALLDVSGVAEGDSPSASQIAFRIAPRMNAAGRMADANDVIDLFLTEDQDRAREIAAQLHELNQERQQAEAEITKAILDECEKRQVTEDQMALVFSGANWHRGVVGIVANRLVDKFTRPVFVLSESTGEDVAQGSGRSIPAFHLLDALESMSDLFTHFGGHRQAAGLTLSRSRVDEFRRRLNEYAAAKLSPADLVSELEVDATINLHEINEKSVNEILSMAPFGHGNPLPVFAAQAVGLAGQPSVLKNKHLRVGLTQEGRTVIAKAWNFIERADDFAPGAVLDVAMTLDADPYALSRGYSGWSAVLKDVKPA
ncbi:MAG: single-stranded-DNA-specific exonuclease RecJ [Bryobacteraceae bacterium]